MNFFLYKQERHVKMKDYRWTSSSCFFLSEIANLKPKEFTQLRINSASIQCSGYKYF